LSVGGAASGPIARAGSPLQCLQAIIGACNRTQSRSPVGPAGNRAWAHFINLATDEISRRRRLHAHTMSLSDGVPFCGRDEQCCAGRNGRGTPGPSTQHRDSAPHRHPWKTTNERCHVGHATGDDASATARRRRHGECSPAGRRRQHAQRRRDRAKRRWRRSRWGRYRPKRSWRGASRCWLKRCAARKPVTQDGQPAFQWPRGALTRR